MELGSKMMGVALAAVVDKRIADVGQKQQASLLVEVVEVEEQDIFEERAAMLAMKIQRQVPF